MKIISHGDRSKVEKELTFTCPRCSCVFTMIKGEYEEKIEKVIDCRNDEYDTTIYVAKCPEPFCGYPNIRGKEK